MRLAALVESTDHVCARYRLRAFQPRLREAGHALDLHPLPRSIWTRLPAITAGRPADVVVLQRKLLSRIEVALLARRVPRLWFDMDDAVWQRDSYAVKGFEDARRRVRFRAVVRTAEVVIAGNTYLAEQAVAEGARSTRVIPTCVDVSRYPEAEHSRPGADLVWVGSASTLRGLQAFAPTLEAIGARVPGTRLRLVCDTFLRLNQLPVVEVRWADETEAAEIAAADIGISWIPDDPWSRGKCGLKVLQYMAAGLPVVTNPVGVHPEMVRHGETGFLASTPDQWVEAIHTLAGDPDLRKQMGRAGRQMVRDHYSVEAGVRKWLDLIDDGRAAGRATA